ncbi:T9SS type A sorting domain-containing protein [Bacteroidota bacterium]|nr:T9SS type A sorting domain-containing protein [Bacteroidota bacterium]
MKKLYIIIISLLLIINVDICAQKNKYKAISKEIDNSIKTQRPIHSQYAKNVLYSNSFDDPNDWVLDHDANDCSLDWQIGIGLSCTGSYPIATILSTTDSDGFAMLDSDSYGGATGGSEIEDSWMTMANPVDLNGYNNVVVEFETQYRRYNSENPYIVVGIGDGNGNVTWPDLTPSTDISNLNNVFYPFSAWSGQTGFTGEATANPELVQVNISPALVGLDTIQLSDIYIRFNWTGTWGYAWFVDDFKIVQQPDNDIQASSGWIYSNEHYGGVEYGRTPITHTSSIYTVGSSVFNFGALDQTNVSFTADFTGPSNFVSSSSIAILESDSTIALENDESLSLQVGLYNGTYTFVSDADTIGGSTDFNNTFYRNFEITTDIFSLDGIDNHPSGYEDLGSYGTASWADPGNADGFMCANMYHFNQTDQLNSVKVLLSSAGTGSNAGAEITLMIYDSATFMFDPFDPFNYIYSSEIYTLTANDVSNGYFEIPVVTNSGWDPVSGSSTWENLTLVPGNYYFGIQMTSYSNTYDIRILDDETVPQPWWSSMIYLPVDGSTYSNGNAFAIRLNLGSNVNINETSNKEIMVYPNPASNFINITTNSNEISELTIKDMTGKIIYNDNFNSKIIINTESYSKGIYLIDVKNTNSIFSQKISIK